MCELLRLLVDPLGVGTLNDAGFGEKVGFFWKSKDLKKGPKKLATEKLCNLNGKVTQDLNQIQLELYFNCIMA